MSTRPLVDDLTEAPLPPEKLDALQRFFEHPFFAKVGDLVGADLVLTGEGCITHEHATRLLDALDRWLEGRDDEDRDRLARLRVEHADHRDPAMCEVCFLLVQIDALSDQLHDEHMEAREAGCRDEGGG